MQRVIIGRFVRLAASSSALALGLSGAAYAQDAPAEAAEAPAEEEMGEVILVTAQRQSESLQDVPIAVSAFSAEMLERQQIENPADLQLTLPNVTFTKTNFTTSSFTIRGIGDLCTGVTCDAATAIHLNESPLFSTRLFETEFFDLERIEVLRGPQGTLFGRNATSGVVNVVTAKPNLSEFQAAAEAEYGNYDSIRAKAMVNVPVGETIGVRAAGLFVKRDGYTRNLFDGSRIDDREFYAVRGSIRWEPGPDTTLDLIGQYFREKDNRLRIQKQLCQFDPTGVLGCLNTRRDASPFNANSTFPSVLTSAEFFSAQGIPNAFALGSIYGPDLYAGTTVPRDPRVVNTAFTPDYFTDEIIAEAQLQHVFGAITAQLSGTYERVRVDSRQDYNLNVGNRAVFTPGLTALAGAAAGAIPGLPAAYFAPIAAALTPMGPGGPLCVSDTELTGLGAFGGFKNCATTPLQYDRSVQRNSSWTVEGIVTSDFDGMFNFLLGGIYADYDLTENSYYVNFFQADYAAGVLGSFTALGNRAASGAPAPLPPAFLGPPFFRNNSDKYTLKSYGLFGEAYLEFNDRVKLTLGVRYNNDKKFVRARSPLLSFLIPYGQTGTAFDSPFSGTFDGDPGIAGNQPFQLRRVKFDEITGRAVIDFKLTDDNLLYASYSRGYKSGGINPPLQPIFAVPDSFKPEIVNAFEIGSKNSFDDGRLQLNLTAFYYQYKGLQLSRIVARTSVNDNVDADIYGFEIEALIRPIRDVVINIGASYLHSEVSKDAFFSDPHDFGAGRADAVIIKDITNGANCAVAPGTAGNAAGSNAFVNFANSTINNSVVTSAGLVARTVARMGNPTIPLVSPNPLRPTTTFPADSGIASTGAFSICQVLEGIAAAAGRNFDPAGIQVFSAGIPVNLKGNELPQAPNYKFSAGAQYTAHFGDWTLVPRADLTYTGESFGTIFNGNVSKIKGYVQANAQLQLNGPDDRWFVRAFVQNLFDSTAVTGLYVTDQSTGLYTNIFTLDPRRYGLAAGVKF